jgi:hypothetical protein
MRDNSFQLQVKWLSPFRRDSWRVTVHKTSAAFSLQSVAVSVNISRAVRCWVTRHLHWTWGAQSHLPVCFANRTIFPTLKKKTEIGFGDDSKQKLQFRCPEGKLPFTEDLPCRFFYTISHIVFCLLSTLCLRHFPFSIDPVIAHSV